MSREGLARPKAAAAPPARVLILSASMGAGHDGAARELARRLDAGGHQATVRDFLDAAPLRIGPALRGGYQFELQHVPSAYDATYRFWYRAPWLARPLAWLVCALTNRRVQRWLQETRAEVVVSTYPLATLALGRLRARGQLGIPAVNLITDFGVHPLWVHRGIDLNLAVHERCARVARARTGRPALTCGPLVADRFIPGADAPARRAAFREEVGLEPQDRAVLVVAGSWGVGDVTDTVGAIAADQRFVPVVVCGRDEGLRAAVERRLGGRPGRAVVFGWSDRMAELMLACDALVENAGGLTSLEAFRSGLPVVSFHPIAGHGKENTSAMAQAGVSRLARSAADLLECLDVLTRPGRERSDQIAAAQAMFGGDGAQAVLDARALGPGPVRIRRRADRADSRIPPRARRAS